MLRNVRHHFLSSAAALLIIVAAVQIVSSFGHAKLLESADLVFGIENRLLFLGSALLEVLVAAYLVCGTVVERKYWAVAWISTMFVVYRLGRWWAGATVPCPCLGSATEWIHVSPVAASALMKALATYLFVGSYGWIALKGLSSRLTQIKFGQTSG